MAETSAQGTHPSPYCGRVDDHPPHEHITHEPFPWLRTILVCPGPPTLEGGHE